MSGPGASCTVLEPRGSLAKWSCILRSDEGFHLSFCFHVQEIKSSSELAVLGTLWAETREGCIWHAAPPPWFFLGRQQLSEKETSFFFAKNQLHSKSRN